MGIGAPMPGVVPLVHVALLFAAGLALIVVEPLKSEMDDFAIDLVSVTC